MLMKTGILYFTTCFHGFDILRHVDPFVRTLHILYISILTNNIRYSITNEITTLDVDVLIDICCLVS